MPSMHSRHMLELDNLEGLNQSLNRSPVRYDANLFQREFVVDLLDDKLWICGPEHANSSFEGGDEPYDQSFISDFVISAR